MKQNLHTFLQFINEQTEQLYYPTHEELENTFWFKRLLELDPNAKWVTGKKAYENGTRVLGVSEIRTLYNFYPKKGTITKLGNPMRSKLSYHSLEDWNNLVKIIWIDIIGGMLDRFNLKEHYQKPVPQFRRKLNELISSKDMDGVIKLISSRGSISDFLEENGNDLLYNIAVAMEHPEPNKFEADHVSLLAILGLNDLIGDV